MRQFRLLVFILLFCSGSAAFAQQLALGKSPFVMTRSAVLELNTDNQGLLFPRITDTAGINSFSPPNGMVIYFVPTGQLMVRTAGYWVALAAAGNYLTGLSGDITATGPGTAAATIANRAVTYPKIQNVSGNNKILGRASAGAGTIEEITLGTGISLSGTTLNVSGISGTQNYLAKYLPGGATLGNSLVYDNGTNVGIGTATPAQKLDVSGNLAFSGALMPGNNAGTAGHLLQSNGPGAAPSWANPTTVIAANAWMLDGNSLAAARNFGTRSNYALPFITNNTERMRLTATGQLGINTTTPGNFLEVKGANPASPVSGLRLNGLGTATPAAANGKVLSVDGNGDVIVTEPPISGDYIQNQITTNQAADLRISGRALVGGITADNGTSSLQVAGDANHLGNVGIGITTTPNASLDVNGSMALRGASLTVTNGANPNVVLSNHAFFHLTGPNKDFSIKSIRGGYDGRMIILYNSTSYDMTVEHNAAGNGSPDRILCPGNVNVTIRSRGTITLLYNTFESAWIVVAGPDTGIN